MNYIVDASVIAGWLLQGLHADSIENFLVQNSSRLYSIEFMKIEVANALRYSESEESLVIDLLSNINSLEVKFLEVTSLVIQNAVKLAYVVNDSVYDAIYHVLAIKYEMQFVTLDAKYYNKAHHLGNIALHH